MPKRINVLLIGGRGQIRSGLRIYLPKLDPEYLITSVDLPGAIDRASGTDAQRDFVDLNISTDSAALDSLMRGRDLVVYLARKSPLSEMNKMTDLVFQTVLAQSPVALLVAASSVHAVDQAYDFNSGAYALLADRKFDEIGCLPDPIPATLPACPDSDYGREKSYVEDWTKKMASPGHGAIAARWGGINAGNSMIEERGYFAVWCHQEDAARFVHACYTSHIRGTLRSGAHYFVISDNTYNIFDIETPRSEIGYRPIHDAEVFYGSCDHV